MQGEGGEQGDPLGPIPTNHDTLLRAGQVDPEAQIQFGNLEAPPEERGIKVLGTPLGTAAFVRSWLQSTVEHHRLLLDRIPAIHAVCASSVPPLGPRTTSGFATQSSPPFSPDSTTSRCGNVWPRFSITLHPSHHGSWPVFPCTWPSQCYPRCLRGTSG